MTTQASPVIDIQNISKIYRMGSVEVPALRGVTLQVRKGERVAIMGPSGSGKSTLMNIMGCLDRPTSGHYYLEGKETIRLSDDQLAEIRNKKIGFVFQSFNLLPRFSALANVELPLIYAGQRNRRQRALQALEQVGLANRASHHPNEISGGEQQRVAIARALVTHPAIIIADEPTGNLDSRTSEDIMRLLDQLNQEEDISIVLVTHEKDVARHAQRIILLRDGLIQNDEVLSS